MTLREVREFPTTIDTGPNGTRYHESVLRSYQALQKVRELIEADTPPVVLLQIIDDFNAEKQKDLDTTK